MILMIACLNTTVMDICTVEYSISTISFAFKLKISFPFAKFDNSQNHPIIRNDLESSQSYASTSLTTTDRIDRQNKSSHHIIFISPALLNRRSRNEGTLQPMLGRSGKDNSTEYTRPC